ncbi:M23 family metallopeptidase [Alkalimarinus sediminis]|uniref:Peptidoglycan DD-metalloendopeptidase family protein n=1 Tax=Alkalimarinus sediminis TaxID=1632866 RepID=A0A9E8HP21_9ALTE|nr:M23 family metallopeptidase [Alkalimarinus sediminis]UZW73841.1 peptidoglycan DD-metalloendopeptidase family protein [Alkalimarinus sediminis]
MNIIFVGRSHGKSKTMVLNNAKLSVVLMAFVVMLIGVAFTGYKLASTPVAEGVPQEFSGKTIEYWQTLLAEQQEQIDVLKRESGEQVDALTLRMGSIQASLLRLDALGQRLTEVAKIGKGEFDFESAPALGGPESLDETESYSLPDLQESLARIENQIKDREQQLDVLDELFVSQKIQKDLFIAGRPIRKGWMSSRYGYRSDPFSGKRAWHAGVDFAGKDGSDIVAVASGVVTWSSERYGYGNLIEINHGGGVTTRYAHCKELLVKVGEVVKKGQVIAQMGSTGRSTGPHVHFEVIKNNKSQNPEKYIYRASR